MPGCIHQDHVIGPARWPLKWSLATYAWSSGLKVERENSWVVLWPPHCAMLHTISHIQVKKQHYYRLYNKRTQKLGLEWWRRLLECRLFSQRAQVWVPAPIWWDTNTSPTGIERPLLASAGTHVHIMAARHNHSQNQTLLLVSRQSHWVALAVLLPCSPGWPRVHRGPFVSASGLRG